MKERFTIQLFDVLYKNSKVCLKGIGELHLIYQRASADLENKWLLPPEMWFSFIPDRECPMDHMLVRSYTDRMGYSMDSTIEFLSSEMARMRQELDQNGNCSIKSLGTWYKRSDGNVYFLPDRQNPFGHIFFGLPRVALPYEMPVVKEADRQMEITGEQVSKNTQVIQLRSRSSKTSSNLGPLIAGVLVLLITAVVLFFTNAKREIAPYPQSVALDHDLDKKINVPPSYQENKQGEDTIRQEEPNDYGLVSPGGHFKIEEDVKLLEDCIIIVGTFENRSNVDKMIYRIVQQTSFRPVVVEGSLIKVGFSFDCNDEDWKQTLQWARERFNEEAWLFKN